MYRDIEPLITSGIGTVGHGSTPPTSVDWPSQNDLRGGIGAPPATMPAQVSSATLNPTSYASRTGGGYNHSAARILRDHRRRDLLASIAEWERASGPDRVWWRRDARHRLGEWRRLYRIPERAAFQQAVDRRAAQ